MDGAASRRRRSVERKAMGHVTDNEPSAPKSLPQRVFVSIAEALTWLAFGDALTGDELKAQVEGKRRTASVGTGGHRHAPFVGDDSGSDTDGQGHFIYRQRGLDQLEIAWQRFRDAAEDGTIRVRGRFTPQFLQDEARLANIEHLDANRLATYSQFDVCTSGIRKPLGKSSVIWSDHPDSFDHVVLSHGDDQRALDGYLFVEVDRAGLCKMPRGTAASGVAAVGPSTVDVVSECRNWLNAAFNADPERKRPKPSFIAEARALFHPRLSGRRFDQAWASVADKAGRSKPGRKS